MIVFTEPSAIPAEMIMRNCAMLTSVVGVITPFRMMAGEPDLRGEFFSPPPARS
jgi:hypothetical protein